jgi:hypothetical protein
VKKIDLRRASSGQSRDVIDEILDDLQVVVDEFNETLPFASEWAAMNALRLDLMDVVAKIEASLGVWEVTRKGVRQTTIEVPPGYDADDAKQLARSEMARLKAEDEAMPADWNCGPVEAYEEEDEEDEDGGDDGDEND